MSGSPTQGLKAAAPELSHQSVGSPKNRREWALEGEGEPPLRMIILTCLNTAMSESGPVDPNGKPRDSSL